MHVTEVWKATQGFMQRYQNDSAACGEPQLVLLHRAIFEEDVLIFKLGEVIKVWHSPGFW